MLSRESRVEWTGGMVWDSEVESRGLCAFQTLFQMYLSGFLLRELINSSGEYTFDVDKPSAKIYCKCCPSVDGSSKFERACWE